MEADRKSKPDAEAGARVNALRVAIVRCTIKDAIAGIGREPDDSTAVTQSMAVIYAALYAQAVPSACPDLRVNQDKIKNHARQSPRRW